MYKKVDIYELSFDIISYAYNIYYVKLHIRLTNIITDYIFLTYYKVYMSKSGQARVPTPIQQRHLFEEIKQHRHPKKNTAMKS